jgi:hypothetical protein
MNDTQSTAVAAAADTVDGEVLGETALESRRPAAIATRTEMSPESLRSEIQRQSEMRSIMTDYVKSQMVEGHHYYSFNKLGKKDDGKSNIKADKPALTQDGAYLICGLFKVTPGVPRTDITRHEDGHFTVMAEVPFFNLEGSQIATGNGSCSTRESKYAYRWVYGKDVPKDVDKSQLVTRSGKDWMQYRLPNTDLADQENTVLKMAIKRASVAGVRKLPLVSELFATDPHDDHDNTPQAKPAAASAKQPAKAAAQPEPSEAELKRHAKLEQIQQICKWLNEHDDSIKWKSSTLANYINDMFDVDDGLRSLDFESLDKLIADLNDRLEAVRKSEEAA